MSPVWKGEYITVERENELRQEFLPKGASVTEQLSRGQETDVVEGLREVGLDRLAEILESNPAELARHLIDGETSVYGDYRDLIIASWAIERISQELRHETFVKRDEQEQWMGQWKYTRIRNYRLIVPLWHDLAVAWAHKLSYLNPRRADPLETDQMLDGAFDAYSRLEEHIHALNMKRDTLRDICAEVDPDTFLSYVQRLPARVAAQ